MNVQYRQPLPLAPTQAQTVTPRVCVIGAGISGLVSLRALREVGLEPVAFELGSQVGGLWVFANDNGRAGAYRSLTINTSARAMTLDGHPWPEGTPDYPTHSAVAAYFEAYAERFSLKQFVRFRHEVERCVPLERGGYLVTVRDLSSGERRDEAFDAVIVANGHHWAKALPRPFPPGHFSGLQLHSHEYVDPKLPHDLRGKNVVVVGMGNSAVDIACELARGGAASVTLSARRGVWVIPKYVRGKPADQGTVVPTWLPAKLRRRIVTRLFRLLFGRMSDHGLPEPDHLIGEAHPTLSSDLVGLVSSGRIEVRPAIASLRNATVTYTDGRSGEADAIVFATGYDVSFPFFEASHLAAPDNRLPLFHRIFHPLHRHVFFVGLAQPIGAIMPIAELQARFVAQHLTGNYSLPDTAAMDDAIVREATANSRRYVASPRHTMQIDPEHYTAEVRRELKRGQRRAARGTGRPFPEQGAPSA